MFNIKGLFGVKEITVYPFKGVEVNGQYVAFETNWQAVEQLLGKPEHRYVRYTPKDALMILNRRGEFVRDYKDDPLPKGEFEEERLGAFFVYKKWQLYGIQPDSSYTVFVHDLVLKGNGIEDFQRCQDKYEIECYEYFHKFSVKDIGMICGSRARGGQYEFYSAIGFCEKCALHRVAHESVMRTIDESMTGDS